MIKTSEGQNRTQRTVSSGERTFCFIYHKLSILSSIYYKHILSFNLKDGIFSVKAKQCRCLEETSPFVFIYFSYLVVKRCNNLDRNIWKNTSQRDKEASLQTFIKRGHLVTKTLRKLSFYDFLAQCKCQARQELIN